MAQYKYGIEWTIAANSGIAIDPTSVRLEDPTDLWGVRRLDTLEVLVASGTALTEVSAGVWSYEFDSPARGVEFEYYLRVEEATPSNNVYYIHLRGSNTAFVDDIHTLGGIRKQLCKVAGRPDLVIDFEGEDYRDNGANYYISAGERWLDRQLDTHKSPAWFYVTLAADESMIQFKRARYVQEVLEQDAEGVRTALSWQTINVGLCPEQKDLESDDLPDAQNIIFGNHFPYKAIYVEPSTEERTLLIKAAWYSAHLHNDWDRSFWTQNEPHLLIRAAMREMEVDMRNTQGVKDFEYDLLSQVTKIYHDMIAEAQAGPAEKWIRRG